MFHGDRKANGAGAPSSSSSSSSSFSSSLPQGNGHHHADNGDASPPRTADGVVNAARVRANDPIDADDEDTVVVAGPKGRDEDDYREGEKEEGEEGAVDDRDGGGGGGANKGGLLSKDTTFPKEVVNAQVHKLPLPVQKSWERKMSDLDSLIGKHSERGRSNGRADAGNPRAANGGERYGASLDNGDGLSFTDLGLLTNLLCFNRGIIPVTSDLGKDGQPLWLNRMSTDALRDPEVQRDFRTLALWCSMLEHQVETLHKKLSTKVDKTVRRYRKRLNGQYGVGGRSVITDSHNETNYYKMMVLNMGLISNEGDQKRRSSSSSLSRNGGHSSSSSSSSVSRPHDDRSTLHRSGSLRSSSRHARNASSDGDSSPPYGFSSSSSSSSSSLYGRGSSGDDDDGDERTRPRGTGGHGGRRRDDGLIRSSSSQGLSDRMERSISIRDRSSSGSSGDDDHRYGDASAATNGERRRPAASEGSLKRKRDEAPLTASRGNAGASTPSPKRASPPPQAPLPMSKQPRRHADRATPSTLKGKEPLEDQDEAAPKPVPATRADRKKRLCSECPGEAKHVVHRDVEEGGGRIFLCEPCKQKRFELMPIDKDDDGDEDETQGDEEEEGAGAEGDDDDVVIYQDDNNDEGEDEDDDDLMF